jgi:IMP dehydrogenase/GMP reductase
MFQFIQDGYVVLDDFLTAEEVEELREAGDELIQNIPNETHKAVFSTTDVPQVTKGMVFSYVKLMEIHIFS